MEMDNVFQQPQYTSTTSTVDNTSTSQKTPEKPDAETPENLAAPNDDPLIGPNKGGTTPTDQQDDEIDNHNDYCILRFTAVTPRDSFKDLNLNNTAVINLVNGTSEMCAAPHPLISREIHQSVICVTDILIAILLYFFSFFFVSHALSLLNKMIFYCFYFILCLHVVLLTSM